MKCQLCGEKTIDSDSLRAPICKACFIELRGERRKKEIFKKELKKMKQVAEGLREDVNTIEEESEYIKSLGPTKEAIPSNVDKMVAQGIL